MGETFVGAFLGFISAIVVEWLVRFAEDCSTEKQLIAALADEASRNLSRMESHATQDYAFLSFFDNMVWLAAISANQLRSIRSKKTLRLAADMYHRIDVLERWDALRVQAKVAGPAPRPRTDGLDSIVAEARKLTQQALKAYLEAIKCPT